MIYYFSFRYNISQYENRILSSIVAFNFFFLSIIRFNDPGEKENLSVKSEKNDDRDSSKDDILKVFCLSGTRI